MTGQRKLNMSDMLEKEDARSKAFPFSVLYHRKVLYDTRTLRGMRTPR